MSASYLVSVSGCDDSTHALVDLTEEQAEGLRIAAAATEARSTYGCQPVIVFEPIETADAYRLERAREAVDG